MNQLFQCHFQAMGGPAELQFYTVSQEEAHAIGQLTKEEVQRIEEKYSRYRPDSIVSRINASAGKDALEVDEETASLIDYAQTTYEQSDGLFDITSGIFRRVWNFKEKHIPLQKDIESILSLVGWEHVEWDRPFIRLRHEGMEIDFGGFGKEYAVDAACRVLAEQGIQHGLVNFAGDLRALGPHADGTPWMVGITHPRKQNQVKGYVQLTRGALATSGDYERFIEVDGTRYCHIINPKTGWPIDTFQSVTTLTQSCLVAGSLSTIAMLFGGIKAKKLLDQDEVSSIIIDQKGDISFLPKSFAMKVTQSHSKKS